MFFFCSGRLRRKLKGLGKGILKGNQGMKGKVERNNKLRGHTGEG